ncbi:MAG: FYDLN acid domain-containing protein [Nitrospinae bacterium]|nr:FYDLN acid domain-containing protein [Nitrospinota bacterium]
MIIQSKYGTKFICFQCECKFYDLGRPEAICPQCKANQKDRPKDYEEEDDSGIINQRDDELAPLEDEKEIEETYDDEDFVVKDIDDEADEGTINSGPRNVEFYGDDEEDSILKNN